LPFRHFVAHDAVVAVGCAVLGLHPGSPERRLELVPDPLPAQRWRKALVAMAQAVKASGEKARTA
jgi:hypothetical protein